MQGETEDLNSDFRVPEGTSQQWASEFQSHIGDQPVNKWADEFDTAQMQKAPPEQQAANRADAMQQTKALRDTLASSQDPKFQQSKFLQFVSKMSRGEIILEDNQVISYSQIGAMPL